tara:strand:- start:12616 stop:13179 length:564 start_codon:yes stop_codon:yes gene_type:complete
MKGIAVADVMTRNPIKISPEKNVLECAKTLIKEKRRSLLIVENKKLLGLITEYDIVWALTKTKAREELLKIRAIEISPKKIATIRPNASISEATKKMKHYKFERLPVIKQGELVGMITVKDILNFHPELYPEMQEFSEIRGEMEKLERIKKSRASRTSSEGMCEECGATDFLYRYNGQLVCNSCRGD